MQVPHVAVAGALGRMGRLAVETVCNSPDMDYVGGFARVADPEHGVFDSIERLFSERRPSIVVDFTTRPATQQVARIALEHRAVPIIGSSEWDDKERDDLRALCEQYETPALIVPNFAIGAVLMMRFAQEAARFFPTAEIVELHREDKRDKPSGTAAATARRIEAHGGPTHVPVHSVRLRGLLAHQEVLFGNNGELLTIRHDSFSRESFSAGILLAIRNARKLLSGLHAGLDAILDGAAS